MSTSIQRLGTAWASEKAYNYGYLALYRDKSPETAKWCRVPAPPSPFSRRRTRKYHQSASHGVALLSDHARYALDRRNHLYVMVRSCLVAPETGPKRHLSSKQKGETGRGTCEESNSGEAPPLVFCPTPIAPKTQNPRPHPRLRTSPTSAPTSARDPLNTLFRSVRTYSKFVPLCATFVPLCATLCHGSCSCPMDAA